MKELPLDELVQGVDSKYTLVVVAARRARQLLAGKARLVDSRSDNPVSVALEEIRAGKIWIEEARPRPRT
ncbi:MAG TPA: DNA-directed RNA polymerase subunit omega [Bacillota bacterium]|nr:DNA-directed RNA polymerase subunit omega [Bacillota bacterium]